MKKVTIEITENSHETKIELNGKTFIQKFERTNTGAKCIEGDFENEMDLPDEIYQEVSGFFQYDVMMALVATK